MISYSGIGSRIVPPEIESQLVAVGCYLASLGINLRSGAAEGADAACERGCDMVNGSKEIFLPWRKFSNHRSELWVIPDEAYAVAKTYYPYDWNRAKDTTKRFMARDCMQVSGLTLDNFVEFVVCYTRDGCEHDDDRTQTTGGTGQAISYASLNDIPVFNLYNEGRWEELLDFITLRYDSHDH